MGFFDSLVRGIALGPAAAFMGGSSGRSNSRPGRVQSEWDRISNQPGQFDSSGGPPTNLADSGIYDEFGYTNGLPGSHIAPDVQYGADQVVTRRNDQLMARGGQQAQAALNSGLENLQSFRPGGAAALLSPYYQSMANTYMQTAASRRTEAPNLMFRYDEKVRKSAEESAQKAGMIQGGLGLVGTALGALVSGGASLPVSMALNAGGSQSTGNPALATQQPGLSNVDTSYGPQAAGGQQTPTPMPQQGPPQQGGGFDRGGYPGTGQKSYGGGGFGNARGPQAQGGPGGGGGGGGPQGGPEGGGAPGGPGAGAAGAGGGGMVRYPAAGPVSDHLATQMGVDPGLMAGVMAQVNDPEPNFSRVMHARLSLIMARDSSFMVA